MEKLKKEHGFLFTFADRILYHSFVYKRYRKCNGCYVSNDSSNMFHNFCFLWN